MFVNTFNLFAVAKNSYPLLKKTLFPSQISCNLVARTLVVHMADAFVTIAGSSPVVAFVPIAE